MGDSEERAISFWPSRLPRHVERMLKHAFQDNLKDAWSQNVPQWIGNIVLCGIFHHISFQWPGPSEVVLVINGLDRLIMELKLPPTDAYHKRPDGRRLLREEDHKRGSYSGFTVRWFSGCGIVLKTSMRPWRSCMTPPRSQGFRASSSPFLRVLCGPEAGTEVDERVYFSPLKGNAWGQIAIAKHCQCTVTAGLSWVLVFFGMWQLETCIVGGARKC